MTNTCFRNRKRDFQRFLTKTQCAQIDQWLTEGELSYLRITALVAEQFKFSLSPSTLCRRNADLITKKANQEREAAQKAATNPSAKAPAEILAKVEKRATESLDDPNTAWTPGRLLQIQRIVLEPWRRQITENRERRAEELKEIAKQNTELKAEAQSWQKKYAQIKLTTPKDELPDPALFEDHPLNQPDPADEPWSEPSADPSSIDHSSSSHQPIGQSSIDQSNSLPQSYSIPTSLPEEDACIESAPEPTAPELSSSSAQSIDHPAIDQSAAPTSDLQPPTSTLTRLPGQRPGSKLDFNQVFGPNTNARIQAALRQKPEWIVPTNPQDIYRACTEYAQLRNDEVFPKRGSRVTQYKYCPCGGPTPCPIHGAFPEMFWQLDPSNIEFYDLMCRKGMLYQFPKSTGGYVLVDGEDRPGPVINSYSLR